MSMGLHGFAIDPAIDVTMRIALALLLGFAAFRKIADFPAFRSAVEAYRLLPPATVGAAAGLVILLEKIVAVGLIASPVRGPFEVLAAGLFAVYTVAIGVNLARGRRDIDCGCGGATAVRQTLHPALLFRNFTLIAVALFVAMPQSSRSFVALDLVTVLGCLAVTVLLYQAGEGLIASATRARAPEPAEGRA